MTYLATMLDWLAAFTPLPRVSPIAWAEANMVLPSESNAEPGPLRLTTFQRGLLDAFADPSCHTIVLMLAAQTGKSTTIDAAVGYVMAVDPGPMLHVSPTEAKATDWIRSRLDPLIKATPALRRIVGGGRKGGGDSLSAKAFPGGSLHVASSFKADDLAARSIRYLFCDEVDRFAQSAGNGEGDPIGLALKRTHRFRNKKVIIASTPTAKGASRIADWFAKGTQERFFVPCPECGCLDYLRFEQLKWTLGKPETAHLTCNDCGHAITERERIAAIELGSWAPTSATAEPGIRSFHAAEFVSGQSPTLENVARQSEAAITPEQRRVFVNTVLAETFDHGAETKLDAGELRQRGEPIKAPYPAAITHVVAGVDVQGDRVEATFVGMTLDGSAWVLAHDKYMGDTSGEAPFRLLSDALATTFRTVDGRVLPIAATGIDSGYSTTMVAQFVAAQRRMSRNVYAVKGTSGWDKPTIRKGSTIRGLTTVFLVGVDPLKAAIQRKLAMPEVAPGFIHLPDHLDVSYFDGLAAESLRTRYVRGYAKQEFHMSTRSGGGGGNEPLDCLVYALAVASVTKAPAARPAKPQPSFAERAANLARIHNPTTNRTLQ